ncbi:MAG: hypothetical protein KJ725_00645 [Gammaproteobacteria bacterium]|nr:hypothetical protein [Gammaproteobacteria bacterium]
MSWSHFVELIKIKIENELKRGFSTRLCSEARWSVRTLRERKYSDPVGKLPQFRR